MGARWRMCELAARVRWNQLLHQSLRRSLYRYRFCQLELRIKRERNKLVDVTALSVMLCA